MPGTAGPGLASRRGSAVFLSAPIGMVDVMAAPFHDLRDQHGRFRAGARAGTHLQVVADAGAAAREWADDEPFRVPEDDPWCGGALTWRGAGFSPTEADAWTAAGLGDPDLAREVRDSHPHLGPQDLARPFPWDGDQGAPYSIGAALRDGNLAVSDLDAAVSVPEPPAPRVGF